MDTSEIKLFYSAADFFLDVDHLHMMRVMSHIQCSERSVEGGMAIGDELCFEGNNKETNIKLKTKPSQICRKHASQNHSSKHTSIIHDNLSCQRRSTTWLSTKQMGQPETHTKPGPRMFAEQVVTSCWLIRTECSYIFLRSGRKNSAK